MQDKQPFHLSEAEVKRGMRASILDAVVAGPFYNLIASGGVFFTGLALAVGANNFQIGLFAAAGPLLSGVSLLSARLMEKGWGRKHHYLVTAALQRGLFLFVLAFPFLATRLAHGQLAWVLLALLFASMFFHYFQLTAWMSWMADMIPAERRGYFFTRRNLIGGGTWMCLAWLTGIYLDHHKGLWGYAAVFGLGAFASVLGLFFSARQPDPPMHVASEHPSLSSLWRGAFANPSFKKYLLFNLTWNFTANLAAPFYNVYMLKDLNISMARVSLWSVFGGILATATMPYWGLVLDRAGSRASMLFALLGTCFFSFLWPFVTPENMHWLLPFILIAGGFFNAGVAQSSFNMFLGVLPHQNKTSYVALVQAVVGSLVGFSPILGGWLAKQNFPELPFDSVMAVLILSAILRLAPVALIYRIHEEKGRGIGFLVQEFVLTNPFKLISDLYFWTTNDDDK